MAQGIFIAVIIFAALAKTVWELSLLPGGVVSVLIIAATTICVISIFKPWWQSSKKITLDEAIGGDYSTLVKFSENGKYDFVCFRDDFNLCYLEPNSVVVDDVKTEHIIFHATFKSQFTSDGRSYYAKESGNRNFWKVNYAIETFYFKLIASEVFNVYIATSKIDFYGYKDETISGIRPFECPKSQLVFSKVDKTSTAREMYEKARKVVAV